MDSETPYIVKWGIIATGHVAERFVKDLLTDPAIRDVHDVRHQLCAVASSSGIRKARDFCDKVKAPPGVRAYGTYAELALDPAVDIVYVATPQSHHFSNVMMALGAGKAVLCEKSLTVTSSQAKQLISKARDKKLFLMEAVWTRFFPLSAKVQRLVSSGAIGRVYRVTGELPTRPTSFSVLVPASKRPILLGSYLFGLTDQLIADNSLGGDAPDGKLIWDDTHRLLNPDLAGGAMLDLGVYALAWIMQILYHLQPETPKEPPTITAAVNKYDTGVDEMASFVLQFPKHKSMGIGMTAFRIHSGVDYDFTAGPPIRIQGSEGEIQVLGPAFRPKQYRIIKKDSGGHVEVVDCPIPQDENRDGWGHGLFWEADECARCLRDKKLESSMLPLDETLLSIQLVESVLRAGDVHYPASVTNDVYDAQASQDTSNA